jgi:hypothetical protein
MMYVKAVCWGVDVDTVQKQGKHYRLREFYLLGYNALWSVENPTFLQAMCFACCLLHAAFLLCLLLNREDRGDMPLRKVS